MHELWALRLEVPATSEAGTRCALFGIGADGAERLVAAWPVAVAADGPAGVTVAFSPSRRRAAVRVEDEAWTVELKDGEVVAHAVPDEDEQRLNDLADGRERLLVWDSDERASCALAGTARGLRALVAPGVVIEVHGPVKGDGGEAMSHGGQSSVYWTHDTSMDEVRAGVAARRHQARRESAADVRVQVTVESGDRLVVVHDATSTLQDGVSRPQWPPHVGPRGVLFRRSRITAHAVLDDESVGAYARHGSEVEHPWLVTPDGAVVTLPFELGNGPIATLPDGRFLLPCWEPMWWDRADEPLTALSDDGTTEPLLLDGEPLTPSRTVSQFDPTLVVPRKSDYDADDAWRVAAARVDGDTLALALQRGIGSPGDPWLLASVPLDGTRCGPPTLVALGEPPSGSVARIVV